MIVRAHRVVVPGGRPGARLRAIIAFGLLAFAFGWVQQGAALHWLSHATAAVRGEAVPDAPAKSTGQAVDHCDECLLLAAFAAGAATSISILQLVHFDEPTGVQPLPVRQRGPPALAFRSRAPPFPI